MRDVLFTIGGFKVRSFGVMIVAAFFAALWLVRRRAKAFGLDPNRISDLCLMLLFAGVLGARVLFLVQEPPRHISGWLTLEFAGMTSFGGVLFAAPVVAFWAVRNKAAFRVLGDLLAPGFLLGHVVGRIGCLLNGCCYGGACPKDLPWGVVFPGTNVPHHPAQIYDALMNFVGLLLILRLERRVLAPGQGMGLFFVVHGGTRFVYEFWRAGTVQQVARGEATSTYWGDLPITQAQAVAAAMALLGVVLMVAFNRRATVQQELPVA